MPFVENNGIRIHYEVEGQGEPLVLQHSLSSSLSSWVEFGYVDAFKADYQLILLDARGHGQSDKPHLAEAYIPQLMVSDIVAILDQLRIHQAHFFGYSMGGWIGFATAKYAPKRFKSYILGGTQPYGPDPNKPDKLLQLIERGLEHMVRAYGLLMPMSPSQKARLLDNDREALLFARKTLWHTSGNFADILPSMTVPCLLFAGEGDELALPGAEICVETLPNAQFVLLKGLNHISAWQSSGHILPYIQKFLAKQKT